MGVDPSHSFLDGAKQAERRRAAVGSRARRTELDMSMLTCIPILSLLAGETERV